MGDLVLVKAPVQYDRSTFARMIDILENRFNNISTVFAQVNRIQYQLFANITPAGNAAGVETALMYYTLPANTLAKDGYNVKIEAWGTFAATANNKQIKLYFGSSVIYDTGTHAPNGGAWKLEATVVRTGTSAQQAITTIISSNTAVVNSANYIVPTEDLTTGIVIKCAALATADADVIEKGLLITLVPQE